MPWPKGKPMPLDMVARMTINRRATRAKRPRPMHRGYVCFSPDECNWCTQLMCALHELDKKALEELVADTNMVAKLAKKFTWTNMRNQGKEGFVKTREIGPRTRLPPIEKVLELRATPMTQEAIAAALGVHRATINRMLSKARAEAEAAAQKHEAAE